jgi:hypothetical protein
MGPIILTGQLDLICGIFIEPGENEIGALKIDFRLWTCSSLEP